MVIEKDRTSWLRLLMLDIPEYGACPVGPVSVVSNVRSPERGLVRVFIGALRCMVGGRPEDVLGYYVDGEDFAKVDGDAPLFFIHDHWVEQEHVNDLYEQVFKEDADLSAFDDDGVRRHFHIYPNGTFREVMGRVDDPSLFFGFKWMDRSVAQNVTFH